MTKVKYELFSTFGNCWLTVDVKTEAELRQMAKDSEVMYKVNGVLKSWKNSNVSYCELCTDTPALPNMNVCSKCLVKDEEA